MIDYGAVLYDPVYAELGVPATMAVAGGSSVEITVIDDTRPKAIPVSSEMMGSVGAGVSTVGPGAFARIPELDGKGIARADYLDAALTFNGRSWVVRSWDLRGSPNGEDFGEVRFALKANG